MLQLRTLFLLIFLVKVCKVQFAEKCGRPISARAIGKIVGGFDIGYFKYPWFVVFMKGDEQYCAGTLISIRHVVTAAHCYKSSLAAANAGQLKLEDVFTLRFGVYNNCATENTQKIFKAAKVYVHELYKKNDPYYDIALVKVTKNVDGFEPCCLPKKPMYSKTRPREAYIQGVGDQEYNSNVQTCTVHEARVLIYSDEVCRKMLQNAEDDGAALKHAFCAGYLDGGIDACQGDSGGPLIILGADSRFVLLGITSFGFECAKKDVLGLYTDASHFLNWMKSKIQKQGNTTTIPPAPNGDDDDNTADIAPPGGSVDWGQYPVTTWTPSTITFVPYQTPYPYDTPPEKPPSPPQYHPQRPIIIIINARNKKRMEKLKLLRNKHIKNHMTKRTQKKNNNGK